ncbi:release factor glutamine methyltransferase [Amycolatopsis xylanica]|uniref:peptide chain release factor N(5)-glutamine methyltransferase n=1 Tax=Amycolatopsis xylanica TaxID=589385 RepID=A0A1H2VB49_9PSEU|nr:putative protein N(5)-glutamine methyltransferase [Amycolatopsis xylanica]SDW65490.1 release factor glutamine methyltransferase [Amycolatopsis xylanica]
MTLTRTTIITKLRAVGCVFAEDEAELLLTTAKTPAELATMLQQRIDGLPLEHVLGWASFRGRHITVDPGVFVPRRRTEHLVELAVALAPPHPVIVDLCCGSGAVAAALATELDPAELHATDIDPAAVACARRNITRGEVHQGDLYTPLPPHLRGQVDLLVANAPYVPTDAIGLMPPEARLHEPRVALDGGADGLDLHRRVTAEATHWLTAGGHLLIETSRTQAAGTAEAFTRNGLRARVSTSDELDATVVIGTKTAG